MFGVEIAKATEKVFRSETRHFKSRQFLETYSAGQEAVKEEYPFGWNAEFWKKYPEYKPTGVIWFKENKGLSDKGGIQQSNEAKMFVKYPNVLSGVLYTADTLRRRGGNAGAWYSTNKTYQAKYNEALRGIKNRFV